MTQILKLKKQLAFQSANSEYKENAQLAKSPDKLSVVGGKTVSPLRESIQFSNYRDNITKSPVTTSGDANKLHYLNTKVKEQDRKVELLNQENKDKEFLNNQMKEELARKNQKIATIESLIEDMNKKINEQ